MPIVRALGITFCGFSISPLKVDRDSQPAYIHIMIANPRLSEVRTLSPGGRIGLNGLPVPSTMPHTVKIRRGTMTPIWMMVIDQPVSSRPRMLMNVKMATRLMPMMARVPPPNPYLASR